MKNSKAPAVAIDPPAELTGEALARWQTVAPGLALRGAFDREKLAGYCQVWARWRQAEAGVAKTGVLVKKGAGVAASPLLAISNQAAGQVRALERELGLGGQASPAAAAPLSLRAYAKHRGVSPEAVSRAVKAGRLRESVVHVAGVPKIGDAAAADREWDANTDHAKRQAPTGGTDDPDTLASASAREKHWKALSAELTYKRRSGALVDADEMQAQIADTFSTVRTRLLGVPSKVKQTHPDLPLAVLATVDESVREALEELVAPPEAGT